MVSGYTPSMGQLARQYATAFGAMTPYAFGSRFSAQGKTAVRGAT